MRTTVTIEPDNEALLHAEVLRSGLSFKEVLNRALRRALARNTEPVKVEPLFSESFPAGLGSFNQLADSLDDERTLDESSS